jgi:hypothetical protein
MPDELRPETRAAFDAVLAAVAAYKDAVAADPAADAAYREYAWAGPLRLGDDPTVQALAYIRPTTEGE